MAERGPLRLHARPELLDLAVDLADPGRVVFDGLDALRRERGEHDVCRHGILLTGYALPSTEPLPAMRCSLSTMHLRPSLAGAVVALLAMPAAAAIAAPPPPPRLTKPLLKCYVSASPMQTQPIDIEADQFMPMAAVEVFIDNVQVAFPPGTVSPTADAAGVLEGSVAAPFIASGQRLFTLLLREQNNKDAYVEATSKVTALSVTS